MNGVTGGTGAVVEVTTHANRCSLGTMCRLSGSLFAMDRPPGRAIGNRLQSQLGYFQCFDAHMRFATISI